MHPPSDSAEPFACGHGRTDMQAPGPLEPGATPPAPAQDLADFGAAVPAPMALTYDDVLLLPQYSAVLPHQTELGSALGRGVALGVPLLSAAMDTVTWIAMARAMAQAGGMGVLHKNATVAEQAGAVTEIKRSSPAAGGDAAVDGRGRLRVAAAVGVGEAGLLRAAALVAAEVDALVVDTAHGHSEGVLTAVAALRARYPALLLLAGNVATAAAVTALAHAGADVVKVGIGPGSICTTRSVSGVGVPQWSAVAACVAAAKSWRAQGGSVAVVADGGVRTSGDVVKALAVGADAVMLGSLLAGADEAPGALVVEGGRKFRAFRGMGSLAAMRAGSADRYFQGEGVGAAANKLVAEGVEGRVEATGPVADILFALTGGLRSGMGYLGARDLAALRARARFVRQSGSGLSESRVHGVQPTPAPHGHPT